MSRSKTKRRKVWAVESLTGGWMLFSSAVVAKRCAGGTKVVRLVEVRPGEVLLSREDVLAVVDAIARDLVDEGFDEDDAPTFYRVATSALLRGRR